MGKSKRPKRLTSKQKQFLSSKGMDATKYLLLWDTDTHIVLLNKNSTQHVVLEKD